MEELRILIIDDAEDYCQLLKKKLEDMANFTPYWNAIIKSWEGEDTDSLFLRKMDILNFQKRKITVDIASDGKEGLSRAAEKPYHVLLLDYHMPGINGKEVFNQLRPKNPEALRIMLSSNEDGRLVLEMAKEGLEFYVEKGKHEMPSLLSIMATGLYFDPKD
jgi:CheY-like chemotaxis protein